MPRQLGNVPPPPPPVFHLVVAGVRAFPEEASDTFISWHHPAPFWPEPKENTLILTDSVQMRAKRLLNRPIKSRELQAGPSPHGRFTYLSFYPNILSYRAFCHGTSAGRWQRAGGTHRGTTGPFCAALALGGVAEIYRRGEKS